MIRLVVLFRVWMRKMLLSTEFISAEHSSDTLQLLYKLSYHHTCRRRSQVPPALEVLSYTESISAAYLFSETHCKSTHSHGGHLAKDQIVRSHYKYRKLLSGS